MLTIVSILLAIETSQRVGGVALRDPSGAIHVEMLSIKKRHDDDLLPAIDRLFARLNLKPTALQAVGVSIGPGGFTGLRIAIATAKMFAETLDAKVIAVPSALVVAEGVQKSEVRDQKSEVLIALAAKNESFWATRVNFAGSEWAITGNPGIATTNSVDLKNIRALIGDEHIPESVRERCRGSGVEILEPRFDPRACLAVAARMLERGQTTDPLLLSPLYPRQPEAVSLWDKRGAKVNDAPLMPGT